MIQLQVTLFSTSNKYRPVSTLVDVESIKDYESRKKAVLTQAIQKICAQRYVDSNWFKQYGYTKAKVRVYNKEKIEAEKKARFEAIKKERGWA